MKTVIAGTALVILSASALALSQQSTNYKLQGAFTAGGNPSQGVSLSSTSFRITLDAVGEPLMGAEIVGPSVFRVSGGGVSPYRPPGEVSDLGFGKAAQDMFWKPDPSGGTYNLYVDVLPSVQPPTYGICLAHELSSPGYTDPRIPPPGSAFYYLVTAKNLLREEGTKGFRSDGIERPNKFPCP